MANQKPAPKPPLKSPTRDTETKRNSYIPDVPDKVTTASPPRPIPNPKKKN